MMEWNEGQPIFPPGTMLHFRSTGLRVHPDRYTDGTVSRYFRIEEMLAQGQSNVYRTVPVRLATPVDMPTPVKRTRTVTSESEKALEAIARPSTKKTRGIAEDREAGRIEEGPSSNASTTHASASSSLVSIKKPKTRGTARGAGGRFAKKGSTAASTSTSTSTARPPMSHSSSTVSINEPIHPLVPSSAETYSLVLSSADSIEKSANPLPSDLAVSASSTAMPPMSRSSSADSIKEPTCPLVPSSTHSIEESDPIEKSVHPLASALSVSDPSSATTAKPTSHPPAAAAKPIPVPIVSVRPSSVQVDDDDTAIKVRLGVAGHLVREYNKAIAMEKQVAKAIVVPTMCGWVEVLLPNQDLWMVGLFNALAMPVYSEFRDIVDSSDEGETLELFAQLFDSLNRFHKAGYVHGDLKWENVLARTYTRWTDGSSIGGTPTEVVLADFEGCLNIGEELHSPFVATWYYMPISIIAHFASIPSNHSVNEMLHAAVAKVVDTGLDLWAFGIMLLEHYCAQFMAKPFKVDALIEAAQGMEEEEEVMQVLEEIRQSFVRLYDQHSYVDHLPPSLPLLKPLLEFCLRRPSNVGLHSANVHTAQELSDLMKLLPIDEAENEESNSDPIGGDSTTARKPEIESVADDSATARKLEIESFEDASRTASESAVERIDDDAAKMRKREVDPVDEAYPVRLPWGNCEGTKHGDVWTLKVPGILEEDTLMFRPCSSLQAMGYPKLRERYFCGGDCGYSTIGWKEMVNHAAKCLHLDTDHVVKAEIWGGR